MLLSCYIDQGWEAGCDEAGRGCLAGPVFAAAVILPHNFEHPIINDSKKLNSRDRKELRSLIENIAIAYAIGSKDHQQIDQLNILRASILSMHQAIENLDIVPDRLLIDGNRFYAFGQIPHFCFVKGDGKYLSIAAASILAKTYRDEYMEAMDQQYPGYGFAEHKGYPTPAHRQAISKLGPCPIHRRSFRLLPSIPNLLLFNEATP
ncbi:MAG: ribonuclease HII [Saprospiraceae bacterium]|nr:ribonuclease HII [Saprospiraceae bacterium]